MLMPAFKSEISGLLEKVAAVVSVIKSEEVQAQIDGVVENSKGAFAHMRDTAELTVSVTLAILRASGLIPKDDTQTRALDERVARILTEINK